MKIIIRIKLKVFHNNARNDGYLATNFGIKINSNKLVRVERSTRTLFQHRLAVVILMALQRKGGPTTVRRRRGEIITIRLRSTPRVDTN